MDSKQIIAKLTEIRKSKKITQSELADKIGIRQPIVSRIERCEHDVQISTVVKISEYLGYELTIRKK